MHCTRLEDVILKPNPTITLTPALYQLPYERVVLTISPQRQVVLWHVRAVRTRGIVVVFPGSDQNKSAYLPLLSVFIPNGFDVILMDYEGFGDSAGQLALANFITDARAVTRFARQRSHSIILFGMSLGTPIAVRIAAETRIQALILEGTLDINAQNEAWLAERGYNYSWLQKMLDDWSQDQIPSDYDIKTYAQQITAPVLLLHSVDDEVTPYQNARRVFEAFSGSVQFCPIAHRHGQMIKKDHDAYIIQVISWLQQQGLTGASRATRRYGNACIVHTI
ncbi:MAG: alpha/beta fold hydrolase [Leptospiraceae bacterium]|nr:alpha/beta fold hydrolase [Leptospiraceae bacterium]